ncbi:MAG TPA: hypothetical protein PK867_25455, partial [Pirellulales bacterium]|nr:hypothetical protein [Pirellulales bacterium]
MLELLLVLALIAAVAAMVWPALARPLATQRLRRAAEQVRMHLIKTRTRAINTGETFAFSYQRDKPRYRIDARTNNEAELQSASSVGAGGMQSGGSAQGSYTASSSNPAASIPPVEEVLPDGINFFGDDISSDGRSQQFAAQDRMHGSGDLSWSQAVLFYPDGTASAARVAL